MALTTGSRRYRNDTETVLVQARVSREAREQFREMAKASGLAYGLFLEELLKLTPVDRQGRPVGMPAAEAAQDRTLPIAM